MACRRERPPSRTRSRFGSKRPWSMNSEIVACVKKGGEIYVEFARSSNAAASPAGSTK